MASSILKLVIEKGPRQGDTFEFKPRFTARIGRVVKGNNVSIKDPGISSNHLRIEFNSDSGKWVITDLDSSNGTIVNFSQLKPFSPTEIVDSDEIKLGELTSIRVEIGEEITNRRNPRKQGGASNLGGDGEIREEIDNGKNPRRGVASKSGTELEIKVEEGLNLEENVEIGEEIDNRRNPRRRAAPKRGHDLGDKVEAASYSINGDPKEENMERGVECSRRGRGRGRGRGRTKKVDCVEDGHNDDLSVGVSENVEIASLKPEGGVSTRRTRSSKRGEDSAVSVAQAMPARRTRRTKNAEDVMASSVIEEVVESKSLDVDTCEEVESVSIVENKKTRGGKGRKKKVGTECIEAVQDVVEEEKMIPEILEEAIPEEVLNLREQPCEEPVVDAPEQIVPDDTKNEQFMEVEVREQEGGCLSMQEQPCAELMDGISQQVDCVALPVNEQLCAESTDKSVQQDDSVVGLSLAGEGLCDGGDSNAMSDEGRKEESENDDVDEELETDSHGISKDLENTNVPDLQKMTLGDWFDYLEGYLPKQVYAATDEIVEDMRKRAIQFNDFMLQQQREKSKLPLASEKARS